MKLIITLLAVLFSISIYAQYDNEKPVTYTDETLAEVDIIPIYTSAGEDVNVTNASLRHDLTANFIQGFNAAYQSRTKDKSDVKTISETEANTYRYYVTLVIDEMDEDSETDVTLSIFDRKYNLKIYSNSFDGKGFSRNLLQATFDAFQRIGQKAAYKLKWKHTVKTGAFVIVDIPENSK